MTRSSGKYFKRPILKGLGLWSFLVLGSFWATAKVLQGRSQVESELLDLAWTIAAAAYGAGLGWVAVQAKWRGLDLGRLFGSKPARVSWTGFSLGILGVFLAQGFFLSIASHTLDLWAPEWSKKIFPPDSLTMTEGVAPWLVACLLAPLTEEVLFRGILLHRLQERWGWTKALVGTSLCFGLLHGKGFMGMFLFSMTLSLLYLHTRSLWACVGFHAANNGLAMGLAFALGPATGQREDSLQGPLAWTVFYGVSLFLLAAVLFGMGWLFKANWPGRSFRTPYAMNRS
jgi:membrane protease YdiL (CAAX protease family)